MASRHKRIWTEGDTDRFKRVVLDAHRDLMDLTARAPLASPEYDHLRALHAALLQTAREIGCAWDGPNPPAGRGRIR